MSEVMARVCVTGAEYIQRGNTVWMRGDDQARIPLQHAMDLNKGGHIMDILAVIQQDGSEAPYTEPKVRKFRYARNADGKLERFEEP